MTIRRSVNIVAINHDFLLFEAGVDAAPGGTFTQARSIRDVLAQTADQFLALSKASGLDTTDDGTREMECLMFHTLRSANPTSEIDQAISLGRNLHDYPDEKDKIIAGLVRDRDFVAGTLVSPTTASSEGTLIPDTYLLSEQALKEGTGDLWMVRVVNSADDSDYVDIEVRAEIMEDAAAKAEAHSRAFPEHYFDVDAKPTFDAIRRDIYRIDENGDEVVDDGEERFANADAPFPGTDA